MDHEPLDITKFKPKMADEKNLAGLFDKMQIGVVGKETGKDDDSGFENISDEESDGGEIERDEFGFTPEDANAPISNKHNKYADLEDRAREDMDFPDEVDTPFTDARVRF